MPNPKPSLIAVAVFALIFAVAATGCRQKTPAPAWVLVIHGGAGSSPSEANPEVAKAFRDGLSAALAKGKEILANGGNAMDAVEQAIILMEDNGAFNAGHGAVFNAAGGHELDASLMDGKTLEAGAVAGITSVRNPIHVARSVMEKTPHVLLAGPGADAFARDLGIEEVPNEYFSTPRRRQQWEAKRQGRAGEKGTVGAVALDTHGNLAAGTSTGGMTDKRYGRVGDSPIIGAGTYADNASCAVSATGHGEKFIRHSVAYAVSAAMKLGGKSLAKAAHGVIHQTLKKGDGGIIAVGHDGSVAMEYNTEALLRGVADADGRFEVFVWE